VVGTVQVVSTQQMVTVLAWALLVRSQEHLQPRTRRWAARTRSWSTHIGIREDVKKLKYLWDRVQSLPEEVRCQWSEDDLKGWAYEMATSREAFIRTFMWTGADVFDAGLVEWMSDRYDTAQGSIEAGEHCG
jgi:hypothetical protein